LHYDPAYPTRIALPCGNDKILALGLCASCYTMRRQDEAYFGGLREQVLARDDYRCRRCAAQGRRRCTITVHHRVSGKSVLSLMIFTLSWLSC
jgi:NAD-dependent dihydropyrimidine dehydrogenase PreA subunit